jgi:hypothetical protein
LIENDEEPFREGSDAVLFEQPGICMEFLNLSRDDLRGRESKKERKELDSMGIGFLIGGRARFFGLSCVIMSLHHITYKP